MLSAESSGSRSPGPHGYDKGTGPLTGSVGSPRGTLPLPGMGSNSNPRDREQQDPAGQSWLPGGNPKDLMLDAESDWQQTRNSSYGSVPG